MSKSFRRLIFGLFFLGVSSGCLSKRPIINDQQFYSGEEKKAFKKNECNPLLGKIINGATDVVSIDAFFQSDSGEKKLTSLKINAKGGEGPNFRYLLLPNYGAYALVITRSYEQVVNGEKMKFGFRGVRKFEIKKGESCQGIIGWQLEVIDE